MWIVVLMPLDEFFKESKITCTNKHVLKDVLVSKYELV